MISHAYAKYEEALMPGGYSPSHTAGDCYFDPDVARKACLFFPKFLKHCKGELAGKPLELQEWQRELIATLYGWRRKDGSRRYRQVYLQVPRKAGKSTMSAGIALLDLFITGEPGAEIYSCAADADQAAIVFDIAKEQVLRAPEFTSRSKVYRRSIVNYDPRSGLPVASYKALSAVAASKHGYNPSCVIFDELHAQPHRELWDVMQTGMGARKQPLLVAITTAGYDRHSICYERYSLACRVRDHLQPLESMLPCIYEATKEDDWTSPEVWKKAQPNLGISVSEEFYRRECEEAKANPAYENTFRRLYLNQWTEQATRWLPVERWHECRSPQPELLGRRCWAGVDLSSVKDLTAVVLAFPLDDGTIWLDPHYFVPEEGIRRRAKKDGVPYDLWVSQGLINATPGDSVDYDYVRNKINEFYEKYDLQLVLLDPWNAQGIAADLERDGIPREFFRQSFQMLSPAAKAFEIAMLHHQIRHGANPVTDWQIGNVAVETDPVGNIRPSKKRSTEKIDGVVASIMAFSVAQTQTKLGGGCEGSLLIY